MGAAEVSSLQVCGAKVRSLQVCVTKVRPFQVRVLKSRYLQIRADAVPPSGYADANGASTPFEVPAAEVRPL
jgi:hypothetical protein